VLVASERREESYVSYFVKITDFGLSRVIGDGFSEARSTVGTPIYVAPEVMANGLVHGFPADCWSLGILLFVLLDGCFPYEGSPGHDQDKLDSRVRRLAISSEARSMISGLLLLNPACRLTIQQVQTHAWLSVAGQEWGTPRCKRLRVSSNDVSQVSANTADLFGSSCRDTSTPAIEVRSPDSKGSRPRVTALKKDVGDDIADSCKVVAPPNSESPDRLVQSKAVVPEVLVQLCECGGEMRIRERKQDSTQFWGCVRFPVCQKTRDLETVCDVCKKPMLRRSNKKTAEVFFGCSDFPRCKRTMSIHDIAPFCDLCNLAMLRRSKKDDATVQFWGCQRFPTCRRTRPLLPMVTVNG
jgi:serine/threonine protein kinase